MSALWNKKANTYQKYSGELSEFGIRLFEILDKFSVNFKGKKIVDVGCGTGVYTLHLAKFASEILASDISENMLNELEISARKFGIKNVKTKLTSFADFTSDEKFDIAFLTMSPALGSEFQKFHDLGRTHIYLNWNKKRKSSMLDIFFTKFQGNWKNQVQKLMNFLDERKMAYQTEILTEKRVQKRTLNEAIETTMWHLEINGITLTQEYIKKELEKIAEEGFVTDTIQTEMRLLVW